MTRVSDTADIKGLARSMIMWAVKDLFNPNPRRKWDALCFLAGEDFSLWAEAAGESYIDPFVYLLPNLREVKKIYLHVGVNNADKNRS